MIHYLSNDFIMKTVNLLITDYSIATAFLMTVLWYIANKHKIQWLIDLIDWIKKRLGK